MPSPRERYGKLTILFAVLTSSKIELTTAHADQLLTTHHLQTEFLATIDYAQRLSLANPQAVLTEQVYIHAQENL